MSRNGRNELINEITRRYREADRRGKTLILDEFVKVTKYHRKYALRVLHRGVSVTTAPRVGTRARIYDEAVCEAVTTLWEAADRICGKRLKAALPGLVESLEHHGHLALAPVVREKLLAMSAATIDRTLAPARDRIRGNARQRRRNKNVIKRQVPVRTFADWGEVEPGFFEADFVVHAGGSLRGSPVHSFVLTDICSGWTEAVPLIVREQTLVVGALHILQEQLPIPLVGIDTDNDSAFINETFIGYCKDANIHQTRSRAYKKNDQAWIEQKNGSVVRRLVGYDRFEGAVATRVLARLYGVARLYVNFFQPSFKLKEKVREGATVRKAYHPPITPCDAILRHPNVAEEAKTSLREQRRRLDPIHLLQKLRGCQALLAQLAGRTIAADVHQKDVKKFMQALPLLWQEGEVRATHKRKQRPPRAWRTRKDPLADFWSEAETWLEEHPEGTAKELLGVLHEKHPHAIGPGHLRTVQRRVRNWRSTQARALILPGEAEGAVDEWISEGVSGKIR